MSMGRLAGKTAIITGAASGIGRETARLFAEQGANLVLVDCDDKKLNESLNEVNSLGTTAIAVCGDISEEDLLKSTVDQTINQFEAIDVVFNNAGIMPSGDITSFETTLWRRVLDVNVTSMFMMCKHAIPKMLAQRSGSIINTSSVMAGLTEPGYSAYTASKAAIIGLTKEIAVSYAEQGIRCNAICPGWVNTEMNVKLAEELGGMDKLYPIIKRQQPLGRMATTREVAYTVLFLASDESSAVTGSSLYVDGAASAAI
ncbi:SDR family NAD(P)-dependent oxidoreductase [Cohnella suwonensis]|uniref:SDR family NAD(P)-dependent oxidoreductase n=1 Tax=Cohnella suwonensis TaxID=696072 RepID=A0ABW0M046_9BACL